MPSHFTNLLPPDMNRPGASASNAQPSVPVPASAVPGFTTPKRVVTDGFWSNLKQFLTEKPIKIKGDLQSPLMPDEYGGGFGENLKDFFSSRPVPKGPMNSRLAVNWGANFGGFGYRIKEFFSPSKQPPLPPGIQPVKVKEIWSKDENFGWSQLTAIGLHVVDHCVDRAPADLEDGTPGRRQDQGRRRHRNRSLALRRQASRGRAKSRRRWRRQRSHPDAGEQGQAAEVQVDPVHSAADQD